MMSRAARRNNAGRSTDKIGATPVESTAPASFAQERLWFLAQLAPDTPAFHLNLLVPAGNRADPERASRAFGLLMARHKVLRTGLVMDAGELRQIIIAPTQPPLLYTDLTQLPECGRQNKLDELAAADAARPFALDCPPLWRAHLVHLDSDDWRLILVLHQAICGPAGAARFLAELAECDAALAAGHAPAAPMKLQQYAEFAASQRAAVIGGELESQIDYWRRQLANLPVDLGIPTDRPRRALQNLSSGKVEIPIPETVSTALKALSGPSQDLLFSIMFAALAVTLASYAGRSDIVVGWPTGSGPSDNQLSIGPWENPLVLRVDLRDDPSFPRLLRQVDLTIREAIRNGEVPFERLVDLLAERDPSRQPLYQVSFTIRTAPASNGFCNGVSAMDLAVEVDHSGTGCPTGAEPAGGVTSGAKPAGGVTSGAEPAGGPERIRIRYATALFDHATVARMASLYLGVLTAITEEPDRPISSLAQMSQTDLECVAAWNRTGRHYLCDTVHGAVLDHVMSWPDAAAVGYEGTWISYQQLMARSGQFARWLRALGTGQGQIVGVCLPKGPMLLPALLGVLAAGAAFLPLEPGMDGTIVAELLAAADVSLVVTTTVLAVWLPLPAGISVRRLDTEWSELLALDPALPPVAVSPEALAIAMPVVGEDALCAGFSHRAVLNRLCWLQEQVPLAVTDRVLHRTPLTSDASVWELFWPLFSGAGVVIAAGGRDQDLGYLADLIDRERITVAQFPPNLLEPFLEVPELLGLECVICSGEPVSSQLAARCFERLPGVRLYQFSGTTETTASALWYQCRPGEGGIPAGKPAANTRIEILDQRLGRMPIGAVGELFVGGEQLASGYLGRPDLTASRFLPDPFQAPGDRLFRTGLLARWRANGEVELLGPVTAEWARSGIRIAPWEIRAAIERHPNVHRAEVVIREDRPTESRLVAYVRWTGSQDSLSGTLHRYLQARLPRAFLPAAYLAVTDFPASADGGVDVSALPVPPNPDVDLPRRQRGMGSTGMERVLCDIWREVLCVTDVDLHDDFFALGGNSVLCVRLVARIREVFGVEFPLRSCFELSTVADYALAVLDLRLAQSGYDIDEVVNAFRTWNIAS